MQNSHLSSVGISSVAVVVAITNLNLVDHLHQRDRKVLGTNNRQLINPWLMLTQAEGRMRRSSRGLSENNRPTTINIAVTASLVFLIFCADKMQTLLIIFIKLGEKIKRANKSIHSRCCGLCIIKFALPLIIFF